MTDRILMRHPNMAGLARPLQKDVPEWESAGWVVVQPKQTEATKASDIKPNSKVKTNDE